MRPLAEPKGDRTEKAIFVALNEKEREMLKKNMKHLRSNYRITLSALLRKVLTEKIIDEEFIKNCGFDIEP